MEVEEADDGAEDTEEDTELTCDDEEAPQSSRKQSLVQPSPFVVFPSSHSSGALTVMSVHVPPQSAGQFVTVSL